MLGKIRKAVLVATLFAPIVGAASDDYPNRPIRWVIPYAAGGGSDALARMLAPSMSRELGQPLVIENKPGAASAIAAADVARSQPDGYTIFSADNGTLVYNPALFKNLPYDPAADFAAVSLMGRLPTILVVGPATEARNLKDLINQVKQANGSMSYASAGVGSPHAMSMELFKKEAGLNMIHVPYKGGALSLRDVAGGQVPMTMTDYAGGGGLIRGEKVRPLAVANAKRIPQLPDVPTFGELGYPAILAEAFAGIVVPAGTPANIVEKLQKAVHATVHDPEIVQKLVDIGYEPVGNTPEEFTAILKQETDRWHPLIRQLNISLD